MTDEILCVFYLLCFNIRLYIHYALKYNHVLSCAFGINNKIKFSLSPPPLLYTGINNLLME